MKVAVGPNIMGQGRPGILVIIEGHLPIALPIGDAETFAEMILRIVRVSEEMTK